MSETQREFDLGDVLTVTTGILMSPRHMDGVYDILNYMTGDNLMTHQLPRACDQVKPTILEQHPTLVAATLSAMKPDQVPVILAGLKRIYGETLPLTPMTNYRGQDPIEELRAMTDKPIIPIVVERAR